MGSPMAITIKPNVAKKPIRVAISMVCAQVALQGVLTPVTGLGLHGIQGMVVHACPFKESTAVAGSL